MAKKFDQESFNQFIIQNKIVGFFDQPITLKSGRQSYWYVNWRTVAEDVFLIDQLSNYVLNFTQDLIDADELAQPDCFYGVAEGATKLGVLTQYKWAKSSPNYGVGSHVLAMGRAKPKEHGVAKDKYFVGMPQGKVIVLEDVTTTGLSLLQTLDQLIEADIEVIAAFGMTNRMEKRDDGMSVAEAVAKKISKGKSVPYFNLSSATDVLPIICKNVKPKQEILQEIKKEFDEFGVTPINL